MTENTRPANHNLQVQDLALDREDRIVRIVRIVTEDDVKFAWVTYPNGDGPDPAAAVGDSLFEHRLYDGEVLRPGGDYFNRADWQPARGLRPLDDAARARHAEAAQDRAIAAAITQVAADSEVTFVVTHMVAGDTRSRVAYATRDEALIGAAKIMGEVNVRELVTESQNAAATAATLAALTSDGPTTISLPGANLIRVRPTTRFELRSVLDPFAQEDDGTLLTEDIDAYNAAARADLDGAVVVEREVSR